MKNLLLQMGIFVALCFPVAIFAQAPNLGSAANFVLFTSTGAVGNTGTSQLTGNVGSNSGSSTGFGNVNGIMHNNNGATTQASADLLLGYNQLNSAIPNAFPAPLLGNGDTLTAGVYKITAVTTLSGNLTLNAGGNPAAVFIFQIEAAFSTTTAAKIKLINGAQACNVFWKIEGMVNIATETFFRGNIVAHNAAINMSTNDTLEGRALSTTGAVAVQNVLAYTPIGCGSPVLTGPAAPNLASTAAYGIFSANGSVTNSGISLVTGDVGSNVGLTVGFDSLNVTGKIHPIPDGSTAACAADLLIVYTYLNTLPADIELLYPAQFGNSLVLTPHTYIMNAAAAFNGTLYLNAQGNADAVFVIKINGALSTGTYSKVVLMNGTQAKNVFWKVEGAVNISDYSIFIGTIVCNNGAISLNTGTVLTGRALTTNGALSTAAVIVTIPNPSILPVSWLYFRGKPVQKTVLLEWSTASEMNNSFFTIEKSRDGRIFETLATVKAEVQNSNAAYSFTDQQPYDASYYRISQTDKDGKKTYYHTIQVRANANTGLQAQHYFRGGTIYVEVKNAASGTGTVEMYNSEGKKMSSKKITLTKDVNIFTIEKPATNGLYLIRIVSNGAKCYTGKLMVL